MTAATAGGLPPAVVLVGGQGTRLRPLTWRTPKQLLPVGGLPLLNRVVEPLAAAGVTRVVLSLGYRSEAFDRLELGSFDVTAVPEDNPLGSGGGLAHALRKAEISGTFLAMNGDVVGDVDIAALLERHRSTDALATILVKEVDDPSEFGVAVVDSQGRVTGFVEKPPPPAPSNLINAGVWVLESSILDRIPQDGAASIEREVFPGLAADGRMQAVVHHGWWHDVGRLDRYLAANAEYLQRGSTPPGWTRAAGSLHGAGARVADDATVEASVIGEDVSVGPGAAVRGSVLLAGAEVGAAAVVERSVIGPGWIVADGEKVTDAICAEGAP